MRKIIIPIILLMASFSLYAGDNINRILDDTSFILGETTMLQAEASLTARGYSKDNGDKLRACFTSKYQNTDGSFKRAFIYSSNGSTVSKYEICYFAKGDIRDALYEEILFEMRGWGTAFCDDFDKKFVDFGKDVMVVTSESIEVNLYDIPAIKFSFYSKEEFTSILNEWKIEHREKNVTITTQPQFGRCDEELKLYIKEHISYPQMEKEFGIQGRVLVKAKIEEDGTVSDISIVRSVSSSLDNEARRVVSSMPKWTPAIASDGKPIRSFIEIPVVFKCIPDPHISLSFSPIKLNVDKYGEYGTSAFEEGCVVFDAVVDKNGKVSKLKINKSQTTIKNSTILLHVQNMVSNTIFEQQGSNNKGQITVTLQYIL